MQISNFFKSLLILLLSFFLLSVSAIADDDKKKSKKAHLPIDLEIISPVPPGNRKKGKPKKSNIIQYRSGWPLTFKLVTTDKHLLGTLIQYAEDPHGTYPEAGEPSALLFEDPDNCPSIAAIGREFPCPADPGEVFLEFNPDVDFPGLEDVSGHGRPDIRALLDDPLNGPEWGGPVLPEGSDGIGYGPNDDLPGLVILSNVGVGIVYAPLVMGTLYPQNQTCEITCPIPPDSGTCDIITCTIEPVDPRPVDWQRASPEARHNLSGLMGSVAYELNDQERRTTVTTSMVVPRALFAHHVVEDRCYTGNPDVADCSGPGSLARIIDGGPVVVGKNHPDFDIWVSNVEIRAVVVNGDAPSIVEECDGEDGVTAADVECNGYTLISNEVVLEVEQWGGQVELCNGLVEPWGPVAPGMNAFGQNFLPGADFDMNTPEIIMNLECPGAGGGVVKPPR